MKNKIFNYCMLFFAISMGSYAKDIETYVVKKNDTLEKTAKRLGVSVNSLMVENGIENPNLIYPNMRLRIKGELEKRVEVTEEKITFVTFIDKNSNDELDIEDELITDGYFTINNEQIRISPTGQTEIPNIEVGKTYEIIINSKDKNIVNKSFKMVVDENEMYIPLDENLFSIKGKVVLSEKALFRKSSDIYESLLLRLKNQSGEEVILIPIDKEGKFYIDELPRGEYLYDVEKIGKNKMEQLVKNEKITLDRDEIIINLKLKGGLF